MSSSNKSKSSYRFLEKIGEGGFAKVYLAENLKEKTKWAVKEFNLPSCEPGEKNNLVEQVRFEASLLLHLNHPRLPKIKDYFELKDKHYIVMDYIQGKDLYSLVNKYMSFLPEIQIMEWAIEICDVLIYLHSRKPKPLILRDLKPQNILLNMDGEIKIIDFGISKPSDTVTKTAAKGFSPGFSPPEQYSKKGTDIRSDIYSLGATLYFLISKTTPDDALERVIEMKALESPSKFRDRPVSEELEEIVLKAMAIKKEERYRDVPELREALCKLLSRAKLYSSQEKYDLSELFPAMKNKQNSQKDRADKGEKKLNEAAEIWEQPLVSYKTEDLSSYKSEDISSYKSEDISSYKPVEVKKSHNIEEYNYFIKNKKIVLYCLIVIFPLIIIGGIIYYYFVSPETSLKNGKRYLNQEKYFLAEKEFLRVLSFNPKNIEAHKGLFLTYINLKNFDKTIEEVNEIEKLEPEDTTPRSILAEALFENKYYVKAIENYKIILNKNANSYEAYLGMGKSYRAMTDYANSIKWFKKALEKDVTESQKKDINNKIALSYFEYGKKLFKNRAYEDAKKQFKEVLNYSGEEKILEEAKKYLSEIDIKLNPSEGNYVNPDNTYYIPPSYNNPPSSYNPPPKTNPDIMW